MPVLKCQFQFRSVEPRRLGFIAVHIEMFSQGNERLVLNQVYIMAIHKANAIPLVVVGG